MRVTTAVLDHVAIGTRALADGLQLFGGVLGGEWAYGGEGEFRWGQLLFPGGPKIELITPMQDPGSAFLERFLSDRGPGPHHLNFIVPDIAVTLGRVRAAGIEPVGVRLDSPNWKEAFLHPRDAYGIVIQVAQQSGQPPLLAAPADLPAPGPASAFALIEHHVSDLDGATRLFRDVLDGEIVSRAPAGDHQAAELTWRNGARLRLVQDLPPAGAARPQGWRPQADGRVRAGGVLGALRFTRDSQPFSQDELRRGAELARRLGVSLALGAELGEG